LVLVAQDTALYGVDLYGRPRLHELLDEIAAIDELVWARVMYAYPEHITPETVESIARNEKICNYLDIPVQHSHDAVLKRMGRKSNAQGLRGVIGELRNKIPGISLRTTLIVGFPGETEEEFEHLRAFVQETQFERLGVFEYSREEDTPAAKMKYRVKVGVKRERRDALMRLQQEIHREKQRALTGQDLRVMVDEAEGGDGVFLCRGRSYRDAYETDAIVSFTAKGLLSPGDVANVRITGYDDYDLSGFALE
jgi:ribosomal protein S12 methylthiotransferase